jgi:hypothetical protein
MQLINITITKIEYISKIINRFYGTGLLFTEGTALKDKKTIISHVFNF